jgi:hypothetical protein
MKGAFEVSLVLIFGMMFMIMGMDYVTVILSNNQARSLAENTLAIIEHQNRYDETVAGMIASTPLQCKDCVLTIYPHSVYTERVWIDVKYPIHLAHMNYSTYSVIRLLSRPLG